MAVYNFERLSILLVEDNRYVRNILEDLLRQFRFGRVATASDGAEAIEYLKSVSLLRGGQGLDLIISDYVMTPINGLLLLRWVRSSKESPNRLMPFVLLSGAADRDNVWAARDLGVTEFLAKPFSSVEVYKKILEVIDYPRQFVATHNYYGPDRRRRKLSPPDEERRMMNDDDVVVVYSADKVVKPKKPTDVWYFRLPNALKGKAGGADSSPGELPNNLLQEAETQLQRSSLDFTEWALQYVSQLQDLCTETLMQPGKRTIYFEKIHMLAHELRGQGGTFGYPLVSIIGKMLYECTGERCPENDSAVEIVKSHVDIMRAVLRDKIAGDGGEVGRQLLEALKLAVEKHSVVE